MFSTGKKYRGTDLPEVTQKLLSIMFSLQNIARPHCAPIAIEEQLLPERTQLILNSARTATEAAAEFVQNRPNQEIW